MFSRISKTAQIPLASPMPVLPSLHRRPPRRGSACLRGPARARTGDQPTRPACPQAVSSTGKGGSGGGGAALGSAGSGVTGSARGGDGVGAGGPAGASAGSLRAWPSPPSEVCSRPATSLMGACSFHARRVCPCLRVASTRLPRPLGLGCEADGLTSVGARCAEGPGRL